MLYEIARSIVQKIFQDKILAGLVIVGILAIFVGGFGGGGSGDRIATGPRDERTHKSGGEAGKDNNAQRGPEQKPQQAKAAAPKSQPQAPTAAAKLEPSLATQFVGWWIGSAMDFNPQTAVEHRQEAVRWITPEVAPSYQAAFWPPETQDAILSGRLRGSFTPTSVQAIASNPDGSIVVNVTGQLCLQQGPRPAFQQLSTDYLVKRDAGGLRIAGLFNRAVAIPGSSVY